MSTLVYLSHEGATTRRHRSHLGFGVHDRKGRELGALIITMQIEQLPGPKIAPAYMTPEGRKVPEHYSGSCTLKPGTYFCWVGNATRAGEAFGAGQRRHHCKTEAERDKQIAQYLREARSRAERRAEIEATTGAA